MAHTIIRNSGYSTANDTKTAVNRYFEDTMPTSSSFPERPQEDFAKGT